MSTNRKLVGEVQVDSGQLVIADPQHIEDEWDFGSFEEACAQSGAKPELSGQIMDDRAFAFDTNHGDGRFNVYKVFDANGKLVKMEIELARPQISMDEEDWLPEDDMEVE